MTLLRSIDVAQFAARGYLQLNAVVPESLNQEFLEPLIKASQATTANSTETPTYTHAMQAQLGALLTSDIIPFVNPGTPWQQAYPATTTLGKILRLPTVQGALASLVGAEPVIDHQFLHLTLPPKHLGGRAAKAQHTHQDSTIDPRRTFDVQLMYFPHAVTAAMGGTRLVPGSHLRRVNEASIGRYQNIVGQQHTVCPAGSILLLHHGIWHGGGSNTSDALRFMLKIRFCPTQRQVRLWDDSDLDKQHYQQRPIFWQDPSAPVDPIHALLTTPEPWFEADTARLEFINRIRLWRYLLGDEQFDADYWLTRLENEQQ